MECVTFPFLSISINLLRLGDTNRNKSIGLKHLYVNELKDLYSSENQLVKALPEDGEGI